MPEVSGLEFLRVKMFLYKYTPPFTIVKEAGPQFTKIDRFAIELDRDAFFSIFDISDFVANYTFNQGITENTYSWSLTLHDQLLTIDDLNSQTFKLQGPDLDVFLNTQGLTNLSDYEAGGTVSTILSEGQTIAQAKIERGQELKDLTRKIDSTEDPETNTIRLSDLIQSYDFISCFVYKSRIPIKERTGTVVENPITKNRVFIKDTTPGARSLADFLTDEQVLNSPDPEDLSKKLFSNDFNGFVMTKSVTVSLAAVPTITLSGNGLTRLFGATRKLLKGSALQKSIYDNAETEVNNKEAFTVHQNV